MAKAYSYDLRLRVMDFLEQKKILLKMLLKHSKFPEKLLLNGKN